MRRVPTLCGIRLTEASNTLGFDGPFMAVICPDHKVDPKALGHGIVMRPAWRAEIGVYVSRGGVKGLREVKVAHIAWTRGAAICGLEKKVRLAAEGFGELRRRLYVRGTPKIAIPIEMDTVDQESS